MTRRSYVSVVLLLGAAALTVQSHVLRGQSPSVMTFDVAGRAGATPWVASADSTVAVAWGAAADGGTDVYMAVSRDSGRRFGTPVRVNHVDGEARLGGELPPRVAVVPTDSGSPPDVVVLWTARGDGTAVKAARSRDGGATFGSPVILQQAGAAGDRGWAALAVDPRGNAHAVWLDHRGLAARRAAATGGQGQAAGAGHAAHGSHRPAAGSSYDGVAMAQGSSLFYASVGFAPRTSSREIEVTPGVCYCCKTALAAGPDGTLVAAWRHVYPGNLRDMAVAVSRDAGRTFSSPVRVSEDGWALAGCPDDGPALVVDAQNTIHMVWPTVVGGSEPTGALFYATSRDGRTFTPRVRVPTLGGPKPTHPQVTLAAGGRVVVAWDERVGGRTVAVLRELVPRPGGGATFGPTVTLAEGDGVRHPVVAPTRQGVYAVWSRGGGASHVEGRIVALP